MSHFTRVKTTIRDLDCLKEALKAMGYDSSVIKEGKSIDIVDYYGQHHNVQLAIYKRDLKGFLGRYSDLGFKLQDDGTYELIVDNFYPQDLEQWTKKLTQHYATNVVVKTSMYQGYAIAEQETMEDGTIRLVMQSWG